MSETVGEAVMPAHLPATAELLGSLEAASVVGVTGMVLDKYVDEFGRSAVRDGVYCTTQGLLRWVALSLSDFGYNYDNPVPPEIMQRIGPNVDLIGVGMYLRHYMIARVESTIAPLDPDVHYCDLIIKAISGMSGSFSG